MLRNIQVFVDVIALLAGLPAKKSVFIYDDSPDGSKGKGTVDISSSIHPGQLVRWTVNAIDVQTQVWIEAISFGDAAAAPIGPAPWRFVWEGYVPAWLVPGVAFPYALHLNFGGETPDRVIVPGPELIWPLWSGGLPQAAASSDIL